MEQATCCRIIPCVSKFCTFVGVSAIIIGFGFFVAQAQERNKELEKAIGIHLFNEKGFSVYDAFSHINRIPYGPKPGFPEEPIDTAGQIFSRIQNQEGRVELKLPNGMTIDDYFAFKAFFSFDTFYYEKAGNCGACHAVGPFTDGKKHVVTKGGSPVRTPSLRNLKRTDKQLVRAITNHVIASEQKKSGKAKELDEMFEIMSITKKDIPALVKFLKLLKDVANAKDMPAVRKKFRPLVKTAKPVDVVGAKARGEKEEADEDS